MSKTAKLWKNGKIPARLFFEILTTQNLKLLKKTKGNADIEDLRINWSLIYDEYFELKQDSKLRLIIQKQIDVAKLIRRVEITKQALYAIATTKFTDDQINEIAQKISELGFYFDIENPIDSIHRILTEEIPSLETRIEIEKDSLKELTEGEASTFEDTCVAYEGWGYKIDEDCSLRRYVAYEKAVLKKASKQKQDGKR